MAGIKETVAKDTLQYKVEPQIVADACQVALKKLGKITQVTRETGMIFVEIRMSKFRNPAAVTLQISKKEDSTELSIQVSRIEGMVQNTSSAQRALMKFVEVIAADETLKGKSVAGW